MLSEAVALIHTASVVLALYNPGQKYLGAIGVFACDNVFRRCGHAAEARWQGGVDIAMLNGLQVEYKASYFAYLCLVFRCNLCCRGVSWRLSEDDGKFKMIFEY